MHSDEDPSWPSVIRTRNWIEKTEGERNNLGVILDRVFGVCYDRDDLDFTISGTDLAHSSMNVSGGLTQFGVYFSINILKMMSYITLYEDGTRRKLLVERRSFEFRESLEEVIDKLFSMAKPNLIHRM